MKLPFHFGRGDAAGGPRPPRARRAGGPRVVLAMATWNKLPSLRLALPGVLANTSGADWSLTVVDNGSADGTGAYLDAVAAETPRLRVVHLPDNAGKPAAINRVWAPALATGEVDYLVSLDDDVVPDPGWLERVLLAFRKEPRLGLLGLDLLDPARDHHPIARQQDYGGGIVLETGDFCVAGACLTFPAAVIRRIGLYDESLGLYAHDDADMRERVLRAGLIPAYLHGVWANLVPVEEPAAYRRWKQEQHHHNLARYLRKWHRQG